MRSTYPRITPPIISATFALFLLERLSSPKSNAASCNRRSLAHQVNLVGLNGNRDTSVPCLIYRHLVLSSRELRGTFLIRSTPNAARLLISCHMTDPTIRQPYTRARSNPNPPKGDFSFLAFPKKPNNLQLKLRYVFCAFVSRCLLCRVLVALPRWCRPSLRFRFLRVCRDPCVATTTQADKVLRVEY